MDAVCLCQFDGKWVLRHHGASSDWPITGPAMELPWRATHWLSSLSHKHLVPVSVRMLNISLWTWCCIAALWSKKKARISMQTRVLHGVRKQPSACQQAQWLQGFQEEEEVHFHEVITLSDVGCIGNDYGQPCLCLFCAFTATPTQVWNTLSQTCCSSLREQDSEDGLHFCFHKID